MRTVIRTAVVLSILSSALPAFAQGAKKTQDEGTTTYNFDDDLVQGDLVRPDGEQLSVRKKGKHASLITIREHFVPEMLKSVEDL